MNTHDLELKQMHEQCQRMSDQIQHYVAREIEFRKLIRELQEVVNKSEALV